MTKQLFKTHSLTLLIITVISTTVYAQKLTDSTKQKMSNIEMGEVYMKKSKTQKAFAYGLLGAGIGISIIAGSQRIDWTEEDGSGPIAGFAFGVAATVSSVPLFLAGARNKGKAEMLMTHPLYNSPAEQSKIAEDYRRKARTNSLIGWGLLTTGIVVPIVIAANGDGSENGTVAASVAAVGVVGSIPFFMNATRNKGRLSIVMHNENITYTYLSSGTRHTSLGIAIPIGN